jgi:hydroxyethylthiazole kinase
MTVSDVDLPAALDAVRTTQPLIDAVTNAVTMNAVANVILHWGGLPVMADDRREVAEMILTAQGLLLNTGDVSEAGEETMLAAGRAANEGGIPIALDPVGVGATPTRTAVIEHLVSDLDIALINGNRAEVGAIASGASEAGEVGETDSANGTSEIRGVEAVGDSETGDIAATALACAHRTDATVVVSGETDVVADGDTAYAIIAGNPMLGRVVGTGCTLGATLSVFAASLDDPLAAALAGTVAYGIAGERAAAGEYGEYAGPASYEAAFHDAIAGFDATDVPEEGIEARIERVRTSE